MRIIAMLLGALLIMASCSDGTARVEPELQARIEALESRLAELEKKHDEDAQAIRKDMRSILQYFDIALENAERQGTMSEALRRNWEQFRKEADRLLEKLQRELEGLRDKDEGPGQSTSLGAS